MRFVLAVDSGGSKCDAVLVREDGIVAGWGRYDHRHPDSGRGMGGSGRTEANVRGAIQGALAGHGELTDLHLVGRSALPHGTLADPARVQVTVHPYREFDAALALADTDSGVVVLAGTGAFVYGRTPDGRELLLDALGPLLGDYGSGFTIGLLAIKAVGRAHFHPRHETSLRGPVLEACRANWEAETRGCGEGQGNRDRHFSLVEYMLRQRDRSEIAALAEVVNREAESGDAVARRILEEAAAAIAETLRDVVDRLQIANSDLPMVATGSVATKSRIYWHHLCRLTAEFAPHLRPITPVQPAVLGVALIGLKSIGAGGQAARDALFSSAAAIRP